MILYIRYWTSHKKLCHNKIKPNSAIPNLHARTPSYAYLLAKISFLYALDRISICVQTTKSLNQTPEQLERGSLLQFQYFILLNLLVLSIRQEIMLFII